jgi:hypothetical protein
MAEPSIYDHGCRLCHECGEPLDHIKGDDYCRVCGQYKRYVSHGWPANGVDSPCEKANDDGEYRPAIGWDDVMPESEGRGIA